MPRHSRTNYANYSREEYPNDVQELDVPVEDAAQSDETLETTEPEEVAPITDKEFKGTVVNCNMVNVRTKPNSDCPIASVIPGGEVVTVVDREPSLDYYRVITDHNIEGYIKKEFLNIF